MNFYIHQEVHLCEKEPRILQEQDCIIFFDLNFSDSLVKKIALEVRFMMFLIFYGFLIDVN